MSTFTDSTDALLPLPPLPRWRAVLSNPLQHPQVGLAELIASPPPTGLAPVPLEVLAEYATALARPDVSADLPAEPAAELPAELPAEVAALAKAFGDRLPASSAAHPADDAFARHPDPHDLDHRAPYRAADGAETPSGGLGLLGLGMSLGVALLGLPAPHGAVAITPPTEKLPSHESDPAAPVSLADVLHDAPAATDSAHALPLLAGVPLLRPDDLLGATGSA